MRTLSLDLQRHTPAHVGAARDNDGQVTLQVTGENGHTAVVSMTPDQADTLARTLTNLPPKPMHQPASEPVAFHALCYVPGADGRPGRVLATDQIGRLWTIDPHQLMPAWKFYQMPPNV